MAERAADIRAGAGAVGAKNPLFKPMGAEAETNATEAAAKASAMAEAATVLGVGRY